MVSTIEIKFKTAEQFNRLLTFLRRLKIEFKIAEPIVEQTTFAESETEVKGKNLLPLLAANPAFDFLKSEEEDIYSDADLKVKY
jgi:hypothetical protein